MTLTKTQKEIIRLMREGWEIRNDSFYCLHYKMFSTYVNYDDIYELFASGFINNHYTLTEKGRTVNID